MKHQFLNHQNCEIYRNYIRSVNQLNTDVATDASVKLNKTLDLSFAKTGSGMISNHTLTLPDNQTLTCEEHQLEFGSPLPFPVDVSNVLRYMQAAYYIVCFLVGVFLNFIVTLLILCYKKLQTVTFVLALQILVSDLVNALLIFPTSTANAIVDRYVFTELCTSIGFAVFFMRNARIYLMSVLVVDRFSSVFMPFWYPRHRVKTVVFLSLGAWILSLIIALIPVRGLLNCYSFLRETWACIPREGCINKMECNIYGYIWVALTNVCNAVILLLYFILFFKTRRMRNKITTFVGQGTKEERVAAAKKLKRERRANVTFFLLFLALAGVSIPLGKIILDVLGVVQPSAYSLAGMLGWAVIHLLIIIDPIVIMRNGDFREIVKKILIKLKRRGTN